MDYSNHLTAISKSRKHSAIRVMQKYLLEPDMISLGGGLPNPSTFPIHSMSLNEVPMPTSKLLQSLQYGATLGTKDLLDFLVKLQTTVHGRCENIIVGTGSQDLICKAVEMLVERDETIMVEGPTYVGVLAFLRPYCKIVEIELDDKGLSAAHFEEVLKSYPDSIDSSTPGGKGKRPNVIYTVPTAGNPTGISTSVERKKEILLLAEKYDVIIMEDDPYYYLSFDGPKPSYYSLDTQGRVLRFDSFSKILCPGARLGFATGPPILIERFIFI